MPRPFDRSPAQDAYRVNMRIRVPEVRVIGPDGTQLGILPTHQALKNAEEAGLDLVEVSPKAMPPVCRIMDYGKFKYEQSKQQQKQKKHASTITVKEIKFRPKTDDHDFDFKVRHIRRFLGEGNKAKLVIIFRGREIVHPETGQAMLKAVFEACNDVAIIEQNPMMEGRRMLMVLAPKGGVIRPAGPPLPAVASIMGPAAPGTSATPSATDLSPAAASDPAVAAPGSAVPATPAAASTHGIAAPVATAPVVAAPSVATPAPALGPAQPAAASTANPAAAPAPRPAAPTGPRVPTVTQKVTPGQGPVVTQKVTPAQAPAPTPAPAAAAPPAPVAAAVPAPAPAAPRPRLVPSRHPSGSPKSSPRPSGTKK